MGIRGLTTFVQNRSHLFMENYELHDTDVVIDGYAVACQLYKWHCTSNDCFGGDYDKYARVVTNFFRVLSECNVTPYVVFDGGYESRKMATVISRMKDKIRSAERLDSTTEGSISVFPLFLNCTFIEVVRNLNIKCVRCDFEGDTETANIARLLNCPVISNDSDFFVFDVLYIPFSTVEISARKIRKPSSKETYNYISCKLYKVDKFLNYFGGMDKSNLPIMAALLGNDYVKRSQFSLFYNHLKIQKCHGNQNEQQKIIKSLIVWLQNETVESAIRKVLIRYKYRRRKLISEKIQNAMKGYCCGNSEYLKYLGISTISVKGAQEINFDDIVNGISDESVEEEEVIESNSDSDEENFGGGDPTLNFFDKSKQDIPAIFLENYRKCLYPPCFIDILVQNKHYCTPQVENSSLPYSHAINSDILTAIHKILTMSDKNLICTARNGKGVKKYYLPHCDIDVPSFMEVHSMDVQSRKVLLLRILKINQQFDTNCLSSFPETWHLCIITLKYLIDKSVLTWSHIYSLLLCKIVLAYVDNNTGFCRSSKMFDKKFGAVSNNVLNNIDNSCINLKSTIKEALEGISYDDSLNCLRSLVSYFQMDVKLRMSNRLFDRNLVHTMAQFQSSFLYIKFLNSLLNLPYEDAVMYEFFNGTFVYNLTSNFLKRKSLNDYIKILLQNCPTVLNSLELIISKLREHCNMWAEADCKLSKRRKKKKKSEETTHMSENEEVLSENEYVYDPNNKFSLLSIS